MEPHNEIQDDNNQPYNLKILPKDPFRYCEERPTTTLPIIDPIFQVNRQTISQRQILGPSNVTNIPKVGGSEPPVPRQLFFNTRQVFFANLSLEEERSLEKSMSSIKRQFPGPAGLYPSNPAPNQNVSKKVQVHDTEKSDEKVTLTFCGLDLLRLSDADREILRINRGPWKVLIEILNLDIKGPNGLLRQMNIEWVNKTLATSMKIPFLVLVVEEEFQSYNANKGKNLTLKIEARQVENPSVKLIDSTGWVTGSFQSSILEDYDGLELFQPGTAIALQNVGFLKFKNRMVICITRQNIVCVTFLDNSKERDSNKSLLPKSSKFSPTVKSLENVTSKCVPKFKSLIESTQTNRVKIINFNKFEPSEAIMTYCKIMNDLQKVQDSDLGFTIQTIQDKKSSDTQTNPQKCISTANPQNPSTSVVDTDWGTEDDDNALMTSMDHFESTV